MIVESLQKMGLSQKESIIYIHLIRFGAQSASSLAKASDINRTNIYDIIKSLAKKGLVASIKHQNFTHFKAIDPRNLIDYLEREKRELVKKIEKQKQQIEKILPALISLESPQSTKPKVTFFEGEKGLREAYEDTLSSSSDILAYVNVEELDKVLPNFFPEYYARRAVEKRIHIKCIAPNSSKAMIRKKLDKKENREMILIPFSEYNFTPEVSIYDNKVLYTSWREKMAIIIESTEIAEFHRSMYKLCWQSAKSLKSS